MKQIQQCNKEARRNRSVKMMNKFVQTRPAKSYIHQGPSIFETNALVNAQVSGVYHLIMPVHVSYAVKACLHIVICMQAACLVRMLLCSLRIFSNQ